jgi:hypothetical protein
MVAKEALGVTGRWLVQIALATIPMPDRRNLPVLVWHNSCTSHLPITSRASPTAIGDRKVEILEGWSQHQPSSKEKED